MTKNFLKVLFIICLINNSCLATNIDEVHWDFQETYPYSFVDETTKENKGVAIDILNSILKKLNSKTTKTDFSNIPFVRGLYELRSTPNSAYFPIAQIPERAAEFKWAGPIGEYTPVIWAKKSKKITPKEIMSALRTHSIGTKAHSIINKLIMDQGFDGSNIYQDTLDEENFKKLYFDRIDMVACDYAQGLYLLKKLGYNVDDYEVIYHLQTFSYSIAFSQDVSDDLIAQIQNALNDLKNSSLYGTILNNYK